jgi:hypothetical protein
MPESSFFSIYGAPGVSWMPACAGMTDSYSRDFDPKSMMRANKILSEAPAQNFVGSFGDSRAANLAIPRFERQLLHQTQSAVRSTAGGFFAAVRLPCRVASSHRPSIFCRNGISPRSTVCNGLSEKAGRAMWGYTVDQVRKSGILAQFAGTVVTDRRGRWLPPSCIPKARELRNYPGA